MGEDLEILTQGTWEVDAAQSNEAPADSGAPCFVCSAAATLMLTVRQTAAGDNLFIESSNVASSWCSCCSGQGDNFMSGIKHKTLGLCACWIFRVVVHVQN